MCRRVFPMVKRMAAAGLCLLVLAVFAGCEFMQSGEAQSYSQEFGKQVESAMNQLGEAVNSAIAEAENSAGNSSSDWAQPLPEINYITQDFGALYEGMGGRHLGWDIQCTGDAPEVYAIYGGTVLVSDEKGGNGECVVLKHEMGECTFYTAYCHLQAGSRTVSTGETVYAGEALGVMGDTGNVTGPHLHLAVFSGKQMSSPYGYDDTQSDSSGTAYIDYKGVRFYNPEMVLADNGQTIINNYFG